MEKRIRSILNGYYAILKTDDQEKKDDIQKKAMKTLTKLFLANPENAQICSALGMIENDIEKKMIYFEKACELDPEYAKSYFGIYECQVHLGNHEEALEAVTKYESLMCENGIYTNMILSKILLEELLGVGDKDYIADHFFGSQRLKGEKLELYTEALYYLADEEYELAYEILYYLSSAYQELNFTTVLKLIEQIGQKTIDDYSKIKD